MKSQKFLIFRLSSIGDIILTSTLVRCLRKKFPDSTIDFIVKKQFKQLVEFNPDINNVFTIDTSEGFKGIRELKKQLQKENYTYLFDIHKNFRSLYFSFLFGGEDVLKYKKNVLKRSLLVKLGIDLFKDENPVFIRFLESAKSLDVTYDNNYTSFYIPEFKISSFKNISDKLSFNTTQPYVVFGPGASFKNKQWPTEYFIELANLLTNSDIQIAIVGGKSEQNIGEEICNKSTNKKIINFAGQLDLLESGVLLSKAKVCVVNDTGMLHMSEALDVPVIGLYGPTVKQFGYFPILPESIAVEVQLSCRPCTKMGKNTCPKGHFLCMKNIYPKSVFDKILKYI